MVADYLPSGLTDMLDPSKYINFDSKTEVRLWYRLLRHHLFVKRGGVSDLSGLPLRGGFDLHHGILSRKDAQGAAWAPMIHSEINCFLLLPDEHRHAPPDRQWAWDKAVELYGLDTVRSYYYGIAYKSGSPPRHFMEFTL